MNMSDDDDSHDGAAASAAEAVGAILAAVAAGGSEGGDADAIGREVFQRLSALSDAEFLDGLVIAHRDGLATEAIARAVVAAALPADRGLVLPAARPHGDGDEGDGGDVEDGASGVNGEDGGSVEEDDDSSGGEEDGGGEGSNGDAEDEETLLQSSALVLDFLRKNEEWTYALRDLAVLEADLAELEANLAKREADVAERELTRLVAGLVEDELAGPTPEPSPPGTRCDCEDVEVEGDNLPGEDNSMQISSQGEGLQPSPSPTADLEDELAGIANSARGARCDDAKEDVEVDALPKEDNPMKKSPENTLEAPPSPTSDGSDTSEPLYPLEVAERLFCPGMKFRGRIYVPGMSGANNDGSSDEDGNGEAEGPGKPYELVVVERGYDKLGHTFVRARHAAYGDEQYVFITTRIKDGQGENVELDDGHSAADKDLSLHVEYADGETCCFGTWNPTECRLEGHVRQRMRANDGIFHAADDVTHVFTLYPCIAGFSRRLGERLEPGKISAFYEKLGSEETHGLMEHRSKVYNALGACFQAFAMMFQAVRFKTDDLRALRLAYIRHLGGSEEDNDAPDLTAKQEILWRLRDVRWMDLLKESCAAGGEWLCADFRRHASLLDAEEFDTPQDRLDFVNDWREAKMDRASAHAGWDAREFLMRALTQMVQLFTMEGRAIFLTWNVRHRLRDSFECFESAYRRAETRLSREELAKYEIRAEKQRGLDDELCIICQSDLLESDGASEKDPGRLYELPCSHRFHERCVRQWLHDHSSCPSCRYELKEGVTEQQR